jgi:hypothetical protein
MSSFRFFCELTGIELVGGVAGESLNRSSMLDVLFAFLCKFSGTDVAAGAARGLLNRSSMLDLLLLCILSDSTFTPPFSFSLVDSAAAKSIETTAICQLHRIWDTSEFCVATWNEMSITLKVSPSTVIK